MMYNASTQGLTGAGSELLDIFHRKQLRQVWNGYRFKRNADLYEHCNAKPLNQEITKARWKLFGHTLRMDINSPAQKAMKYYFDTQQKKTQFRRRPRTTIATILNSDVKEARKTDQRLPEKLESLEDLEQLRSIEVDRVAGENTLI